MAKRYTWAYIWHRVVLLGSLSVIMVAIIYTLWGSPTKVNYYQNKPIQLSQPEKQK